MSVLEIYNYLLISKVFLIFDKYLVLVVSKMIDHLVEPFGLIMWSHVSSITDHYFNQMSSMLDVTSHLAINLPDFTWSNLILIGARELEMLQIVAS